MDEELVISPSGLRSPSRYLVIHDFKATKSDEIDLNKGDVVFVVKRYRDGWFRGIRCRGYEVGCFPGNFVASEFESPTLFTERQPTFSFDIEAPPLPPKASSIKTGILIDIEEEPQENNTKQPFADFYDPEYPESDEAPELPKKIRQLRKSREMDINYNNDEPCDKNTNDKHIGNGQVDYKLGHGFDSSVHTESTTISTSSLMGLKMLQASDLSKYPEDSSERKRTRAAEELLTSEMSYFSGLNVLISNYLKPLKDLNIISKEDIQKIFSNVESLASISKEMVSKLQKRLAKWDVETTEIGDVLLEMFSYLKMFEPYFNSRNKGNEVKAKLEKSNEKFKAITSKVISGQTLNSLLLMPIQRIPRYEMLLKEIVKRTKEDHPDYKNLNEALSKARKGAADLNEHIRRIENETKVIEIMRSFPNDELNLIHAASQVCLGKTFASGRLKKQEREQMSSINKKVKRLSLPLANAIDVTPKIPRSNTASPVPGVRHHDDSESDSDSDSEPTASLGDKFITSIHVYEGAVERVTRKATGSSEGGMVHETVERYLFLFNDVLLVSMASDNLITGKRTHKLKTAIPLCQAWVTQSYVYYSSPPENMFLLGTPSHIYKFLAPSVKEKECWEQKLKECIAQAKEAITNCFKGLPLPDQQFTAVTVEAKIDYHKVVDIELNLREKEEVLVIGYKDGDVWRPGLYRNDAFDFTSEWWPGIQKGKFGWFPAQCVTGPDATMLSVSEDGIHPIPTAVALNQIKRTMMMWTGSSPSFAQDVKVIKIYRPDKTFKTCKVESEFTIEEVLRQYTHHKSFCGAKIDTDNLDLWEESLDGSVNRLLPKESSLGGVIGSWGEYKVNMRLVIREKGETRAGSKSVILDM